MAWPAPQDYNEAVQDPSASFADPELRARIDYKVEFNWGPSAPAEGVPADHFSIRWQGWLWPPAAGTYTLVVQAVDGARVSLDGQVVLDSWGKTGRTTTPLVLEERPYRLVVEHHEGVGLALMYLGWIPGDGPEQAVPTEALYHDPVQEKLLAR
jgi:hypothetical protein